MDPITLGMSFASIGASLFGQSSANKQAKAQQRLQERQVALSEQDYYNQLQRQQEWNEKYGSIEHNMLRYVQNLDATKIYNQNSGVVKQAFDNARKNIDSHLAERGFDVAGGVHADMFTQLADQEAQALVQLRQNADKEVFNTQQAVLSGNPEPQPNTAGMQNTLNNSMVTSANNYKMITNANQDVFNSITAFGRHLANTNTDIERQRQIDQEHTFNSPTANALRR